MFGLFWGKLPTNVSDHSIKEKNIITQLKLRYIIPLYLQKKKKMLSVYNWGKIMFNDFINVQGKRTPTENMDRYNWREITFNDFINVQGKRTPTENLDRRHQRNIEEKHVTYIATAH